MYIKRVELSNFKSYESQLFEFSPGATAITGPNGSGKTSIIEAIAWTLFDTLEYKKDEVIRKGAKKAAVKVTYISGSDEREYTVHRDSGNGYYIYDERLGVKMADKKEDVTRTLRGHMGVEPGTDLSTLYRQAIGVPQGTFTAIFLGTAAHRKPVFDTLLRVDEYRRAADQLRATEQFVAERSQETLNKIARAEGQLEQLATVEEDLVERRRQNEELAATSKRVEGDVASTRSELAELDARERAVTELGRASEQQRAEAAKAELVLRHADAELQRSRSAVEIVERSRAASERHIAALETLRVLEERRSKRHELMNERARIERAEAGSKAELARLRAELDRIAELRSQLTELDSKVPDQDRLEAERHAIVNDFAAAQAASTQLSHLDRRIDALRESWTNVRNELGSAREKAKHADRVTELETEDSDLRNELADEEASFRRDQSFREQIKDGLCPILSAKCLNLAEGQTLGEFLDVQADEFRSRRSGLQLRHKAVVAELAGAREAVVAAGRIAILETRAEEVKSEGQRLKAQKDELAAAAEKLAELEDARVRVDAELKKLGDVRGRAALLRTDVGGEESIRESVASAEHEAAKIAGEMDNVMAGLSKFDDLDELFAAAHTERDSTASAHKDFLTNEAAAALTGEHEEIAKAARDVWQSADAEAQAAERELGAAASAYDIELHSSVKQKLVGLERELTEAVTLLKQGREIESRLARDVSSRAEIKNLADSDRRRAAHLKEVSETTKFIRSTFKEAAPLVAKNYVFRVSSEANQLFREIGGHVDRTLVWEEDYGISVEEGGYSRPFVSLSGGEQMAAAIAVRLALLKQLSDIKIAFFDEPTTNMDHERRENLAQQIGQIGHFDQLLVISHDDTFEGFLDNEVRVGD